MEIEALRSTLHHQGLRKRPALVSRTEHLESFRRVPEAIAPGRHPNLRPEKVSSEPASTSRSSDQSSKQRCLGPADRRTRHKETCRWDRLPLKRYCPRLAHPELVPASEARRS